MALISMVLSAYMAAFAVHEIRTGGPWYGIVWGVFWAALIFFVEWKRA